MRSERVVVDGDRVARLDLELDRRTVGGRDAFADTSDLGLAPRRAVAAETVRIVPARKAVSGMMFVVVPATTWAIVTTAGSKASTRRVTISWKRQHDLGGDGDRVDRACAASRRDRRARGR